MSDVLYIIYLVLFWITEVNAIYYGILYLFGLILHKQKYPMVEDKQKFCIFVPCHNEGPVVESTVKDYVNINYRKDLFDIYFIADNCKDNTAEILKKTIKECGVENFHVLVRTENDPKKRGKPHALRWGIETLEKENKFYNKYDMFMILDADNFVDADILKHVNSQYLSYKENKRPVMIQTYLDSKNKNTLIARGYFETYRVMNGFFQLSKHQLGLVPGIGGTGFAITTEFLKSIGGFNCTSLTEDLEIQTIATVKNKKVVYNKNVRIYDEKPTGLKQSIVQRTRWAQGHWFVALKYVPRLFIQLFNPKTIKATFKKIDMLMYLLSRMFIVCATIMLFLGLYFAIAAPGTIIIPHPFSYINIGLLIFSLIIVPISSLLDGKEDEKKRVLIELVPNILSIYIISAMDMYTSIVGLFKCWDQKTWKKTAHKITSIKGGKFEENNKSVMEVKTIDENKSNEIVLEIKRKHQNNKATINLGENIGTGEH